MKTIKARKLPRRLTTVADFSSVRNHNHPTNETDHTSDTTVTMTIIVTTISTHPGLRN